MKFFTTQSGLTFLCFMLVTTEVAAAWNWDFGFIFDNLLFGIGLKHEPNCNHFGPLRPKMCKIACPEDNNSDSDSSSGRIRRILDENNEDAESSGCAYYAESSKKREQCDNIVCGDSASAAEIDYNEYSDNSSSGESNSNVGADSISTGISNSSRMSFLPYIIAAVVGTMFLGIFVLKKRRDQQEKEREEELLGNDSLHGSIAKRINNIESGRNVAPIEEGTETNFVKTTGYALA